MRIAFTESAKADLDEILRYLASNRPSLVNLVEQRIRTVLDLLSQWPESAPEIAERPGIRVASLIRYPYRIFYRVNDDTIEIVHIHHTSRRPWYEAK